MNFKEYVEKSEESGEEEGKAEKLARLRKIAKKKRSSAVEDKDTEVNESMPESEMNPATKKASKEAKAEKEKMLAKQRAAFGLPPRTWQQAQQDPEEGPESPWAKRIQKDVQDYKKKRTSFAAFAAAKPKKKVEEGREVQSVGPYVTSRKWTKVTDPSKKRAMRARNSPIKREDVPSVRDIKKKEAESRKESFAAAGRMASRSRFAN